jgi:hypothetical protein
MTPTYGGLPIFGYAVNVAMVPNANASQIAAFFGVQGVQAMDGGGRGRAFEITGLMAGTTPASVQFGQQQLESLADGVARVLVDTTGFGWANVVYKNDFSWTGKYMWSPTLAAWVRQYRCVMYGLT